MIEFKSLDGSTLSEYGKKELTRKAEALHANITLIEYGVDRDTGELLISYKRKTPSFERIRRITGYLVGTLDRFNDAKRAEEHDRVKHGVFPQRGIEPISTAAEEMA